MEDLFGFICWGCLKLKLDFLCSVFSFWGFEFVWVRLKVGKAVWLAWGVGFEVGVLVKEVIFEWIEIIGFRICFVFFFEFFNCLFFRCFGLKIYIEL